MDLQLQGDAALVTASSSGLGKASARALAQEGANVVMNSRDEARLQAAVEDVREDADGDVVGQVGDLTEPSDIEALVERTVEEFGTVDHLVTNAGGPPSGPFLEKTEGDWYDAYDLLVMSVVRLVHEAAESLQDGGGTIVNIASSSVKEAIDGLVLSNSVRMSVIGLEKTLSKELAPDVRANAVLPGVHETPRVEEVIEQGVERGDYEDYQDGLEDHRTGIPVGRTGDPMELGRTVAFLSSPQAGYINGETVTIDGGAGSSNL
ncbi:SDR family oxidoreductase [Halobacterium sp. R2-5]|uniref:SDR family oxidoreductase n=1 Tax=Halobacterium sp. R2-5 TaxID=2715751 RepID=UPI00141EB616|nr:SDR family oxidoreductase [Halobacterium sp. R2-5]NIC00747.1 SDR family oxidoreductase [Halobacterium sp. R2-5]